MKQKVQERVGVKQTIQDRIEKINQGIVPDGYKQTKVGIIPEDWEVKNIAEVSDVINGGTPKTTIKEYWNGNVMWATPTDLNRGNKYLSKTDRTISELGVNKSSTKLLPVNSILMTSRATIGERAINRVPMCTNQGFKSFICLESLHFEFFYYLIGILKMQFVRLASGSTFLELSKSDVDNFLINIPPIIEQQKIADMLSTWDRAIELKKSLIKEKEEQKKGLMKNFLEKDANQNWKLNKLKDISIRITTKNNNRSNNVLTISAQAGLVNQEEYFTKRIASKNLTNYIYLEKNDFAYNKSYSKGYPFGTIRMLENYTEGIVSSLYICFRVTDNTTREYLKHYFNHNFFNKEIYKIAQEGARNHGLLNIGIADFFNINIKLPPLPEQQRIANILSTADREIELLKELVEELKEEKKGLMQLLLTGIIRVKGEDDE